MIEGDPNLGSLHSLIRHASQWANVIPSFKSEWSKLPKEARTLVAKVEKGEAPAKGFIDSLAKLNISSSMNIKIRQIKLELLLKSKIHFNFRNLLAP